MPNNRRPETKGGTPATIPAGAGLSGRILIQIIDSAGNTFDVTKEILSMGVTVGEPNSIVALQRPVWAAFTQGSRDATNSQNIAADGTAYFNNLTDIIMKTNIAADGEIQTWPGPAQDGTYGYLTGLVDDAGAGQDQRADATPVMDVADWGTANWENNKEWNAIVPINVYNVREGCIDAVNCDAVYERGITNVVELNMRNLARWVDGVYDTNLLAGTSAVSTNIANPGGFTVYVSDRRGDNVKPTVNHAGVNVNSTNGMVDNEDIYGPNGALDAGEDVQANNVLFPLSRTWSDSAGAMYPGLLGRRIADQNLPGVTAETAVRAGLISGNNLSALAGLPDAGNAAAGESRLNGGIHNFPRFLERWGARWNFIGSLIPLYHSSQAVGQYNADSTIYGAPVRNWAFDSSFLDPNRLPPSTPQFQYVQPTAFRQIF